MSYEKDLDYLKKEYKKSSEKLREAEICGHQADVDIWENDLVNISHQIYIHEQASKAEIYEAKAQAFDEVKEIFKIDQNDEDFREMVLEVVKND